jgi:hypothetical protein
VRAIKAEQVATGRPADALTCSREVLRRNPPRRLRGLWVELTGAAADTAIAGNLSAMGLDPPNLGVSKSSKSSLIIVDDGDGGDSLGDPEIKVGDLPRELVCILGGEALQLVSDEVGSFDGI